MRAARMAACALAAALIVSTTGTGQATGSGMNAPRLGAAYATWSHALGARMRNTSADLAGWRPCSNHTTAGLLVTFVGTRAVSVLGQACANQHPSLGLRRSEALRYLPPDARAQGNRMTDEGQVLLFWSPSLARLLPRYLFVDCDGNAVRAGTLALNLHRAHETGWALAAGACA